MPPLSQAAVTGSRSTVLSEDDPSRWLSVAEVAERLGVSKSYTYKLLATGLIPSRLLGRRRLVKPSALHAFVESLPSDRD